MDLQGAGSLAHWLRILRFLNYLLAVGLLGSIGNVVARSDYLLPAPSEWRERISQVHMMTIAEKATIFSAQMKEM